MNYEQLYKDALERAKKNYKTAQDLCEGSQIGVECFKNTLTNIFPELKESEDERIRKELIAYHRSMAAAMNGNRPCVHEAWIAWLEKQGEQKSIWHDENEEPERGSLILLIMQSGNPIVAKIIEPNHTFNHGERWAYIDDLLEKKWNDSYLQEKIESFTDAHKGEDQEGIIAACRGGEEQGESKLSNLGSIGENWSEEDKKKLNRIYQLIAEAADEHAFSTTCRLIGDKECVELQDFLKSLKPQPKQELSEEDIIKKHITNDSISDVVNARCLQCGWSITSEFAGETIEKLKKLGWDMYYAYQGLTNDTSRIRKAMEAWWKYINYELNK